MSLLRSTSPKLQVSSLHGKLEQDLMHQCACATPMAIFDCVLSWSQGKISRVLLLVGLALCLHRVWRRWRGGKAMRGVAGKVVLITGASSGLGEGMSMHDPPYPPRPSGRATLLALSLPMQPWSEPSTLLVQRLFLLRATLSSCRKLSFNWSLWKVLSR